jgi:hypothetical protein
MMWPFERQADRIAKLEDELIRANAENTRLHNKITKAYAAIGDALTALDEEGL